MTEKATWRLTEEQKEQVVTMYSVKNMTTQAIADQFTNQGVRITRQAIEQILKSRGVDRRSARMRHTPPDPNQVSLI